MDQGARVGETQGVGEVSFSDQDSPVEIAEEAVDVVLNSYNIHDVPEHIIICIDVAFCDVPDKKDQLIKLLITIISAYKELKAQINSFQTKMEFSILLISQNKTHFFPVDNRLKLNNLAVALHRLETTETGPMNLSVVFSELVQHIRLPDPKVYQLECIQPPFVYHILFFFGHNRHLPVMTSTNEFDYLMMTKFVAVDYIYLYHRLEGSKVKKIRRILSNLNENQMGYFFDCPVTDRSAIEAAVFKCLGHPLVRYPKIDKNGLQDK